MTHRPRLAGGDPPLPRRGSAPPLLLDGRIVGAWVCTRDRTRALARLARAGAVAARPVG